MIMRSLIKIVGDFYKDEDGFVATALGLSAGAAAAISAGVAAAGTAAGAIGGALKGPAKNVKELAPKSDLEVQAEAATSKGLSSFEDLMGKGPGASDVTAGLESQRSLASMLSDYQKSGGLPGAEDISTGQSLAGRLFAGQRQAQSDAFKDQSQQFSAQAALMGRSPLDPVMRNKLMQEQTRAQGQLAAEQYGAGTQIAMEQPGKRLGYAQSRASVLGGLASQAMANRQALFSMGQAALGQQQKFRSDTATEIQYSGGEGLSNALSGGIAGLGAGMSAGSGIMNRFNAAGGGGGGGQASPAAPSNFGLDYSAKSMGIDTNFANSFGGQFASSPIVTRLGAAAPMAPASAVVPGAQPMNLWEAKGTARGGGRN